MFSIGPILSESSLQDLSLKRPRSSDEILEESKVKRHDSHSYLIPPALSFTRTHVPVPDVIIRQAHLQKSNIRTLLGSIDGYLTIMGPKSSIIEKIPTSGYSSGHQPMILITFTGDKKELVHNIQSLLSSSMFQASLILGVTAKSWSDTNQFDFPILLDETGTIAKKLKVLDPLGGGVYPLNSVVVFDRRGDELLRIKLGYDGGVYYDQMDNPLDVVLREVIEYGMST